MDIDFVSDGIALMTPAVAASTLERKLPRRVARSILKKTL
jgi:hypothetical protein